MKELLFPPGATSHDWVLDALLAAGMAALTVPPYAMSGPGSGGDTAQFVAALLMVLPLVLRRHSPLLMLLGVTVAGLVQLVVSDTPMASLAAIPVVAYSVARWIPGRESRLVLVIGAISAVLGPLRWVVDDPAHVSVRDMLLIGLAWFVCLGLVITPYAIGRRARESTEFDLDRLAAAEDSYQRLLAEREQQNRLAESRARSQIARELHDIVAHSLSVMIVQAEGARAVVARKPEVAAEALSTIAETGREALSEMRRIVGVLRDPAPASEGQVDFAPAPTLEDIPELVARTSDRARLEVRGQPPRASAALALTAYRVVQEALTNFLKHAGPDAIARVTVTYGKDDIVIDVLDNGVGASGEAPAAAGHGLRGMNERVSSMGGRLLTRSRPSGGFQVTAVLPNGN
ncbi:MAG: sensor histidine kinase [Propionibacteriaceae bacterium]|jgi:signal transduction histidine kinase|nr:sensor histidine kinase [Propionibacteriaceae bacterium]